MMSRSIGRKVFIGTSIAISALFAGQLFAANTIQGRVLGAGAPIATLDSHSLAGERRRTQTARTNEDRQGWPVHNRQHWRA